MASWAACGLLCLALLAAGCARGRETGRLPLTQVADLALPGGVSRFDFASLDADRHLLFISHLGASQVVVVDTTGPRVRGVVGDMSDVHGVLVLPGPGVVLAAITGRDEVAVIDEDSASVTARAADGEVSRRAGVRRGRRSRPRLQRGGRQSHGPRAPQR